MTFAVRVTGFSCRAGVREVASVMFGIAAGGVPGLPRPPQVSRISLLQIAYWWKDQGPRQMRRSRCASRLRR